MTGNRFDAGNDVKSQRDRIEIDSTGGSVSPTRIDHEIMAGLYDGLPSSDKIMKDQHRQVVPGNNVISSVYESFQHVADPIIINSVTVSDVGDLIISYSNGQGTDKTFTLPQNDCSLPADFSGPLDESQHLDLSNKLRDHLFDLPPGYHQFFSQVNKTYWFNLRHSEGQYTLTYKNQNDEFVEKALEFDSALYIHFSELWACDTSFPCEIKLSTLSDGVKELLPNDIETRTKRVYFHDAFSLPKAKYIDTAGKYESGHCFNSNVMGDVLVSEGPSGTLTDGKLDSYPPSNLNHFLFNLLARDINTVLVEGEYIEAGRSKFTPYFDDPAKFPLDTGRYIIERESCDKSVSPSQFIISVYEKDENGIRIDASMKKLTIHQVKMPDHGAVFLNQDEVIRYSDIFKKAKQGSLAAHCSAGIGRSVSVAAVYNILNMTPALLDDASVPDVARVLEVIGGYRGIRPGCVQKPSQLEMVLRWCVDIHFYRQNRRVPAHEESAKLVNQGIIHYLFKKLNVNTNLDPVKSLSFEDQVKLIGILESVKEMNIQFQGGQHQYLFQLLTADDLKINDVQTEIDNINKRNTLVHEITRVLYSVFSSPSDHQLRSDFMKLCADKDTSVLEGYRTMLSKLYSIKSNMGKLLEVSAGTLNDSRIVTLIDQLTNQGIQKNMIGNDPSMLCKHLLTQINEFTPEELEEIATSLSTLYQSCVQVEHQSRLRDLSSKHSNLLKQVVGLNLTEADNISSLTAEECNRHCNLIDSLVMSGLINKKSSINLAVLNQPVLHLKGKEDNEVLTINLGKPIAALSISELSSLKALQTTVSQLMLSQVSNMKSPIDLKDVNSQLTTALGARLRFQQAHEFFKSKPAAVSDVNRPTQHHDYRPKAGGK